MLTICGSGGLVFCTTMIADDLHDSLFVVSCPQSKQEIHRRSARLRSTKYKAPASEKKVSTKGKGRRHIFKLKNVRGKFILLSVTLVTVLHYGFMCIWHQRLCVCDLFPQPIKAPESVATIITSESVFYKVGNWFQSSSSSITFPFLMGFCYFILLNWVFLLLFSSVAQ